MNDIDPAIWQGPTSLTTAGAVGAALLVGVALICLVTAWRRRGDRTREPLFWLVVAILLVLAAVYRASGWEHRLGNDLRVVAYGEHWYGKRPVPQALATVTAVLVMSASALAAIRYRERVPPSLTLPGLAMLALIGLYLVRVVSLHLVDAFLYAGSGPLRVNWVAEAVLLAIVAWGAARRMGLVPRRNAARRRDANRW